MGRLFLPLFGELAPQRPNVDAVRQRLGGRARSEAGVGEIVRIGAASERDRLGVVLFVRAGDADVLTERGVIHRIARGELSFVDRSELSNELAIVELAADACVFRALEEGDRVRYLDRASGLGSGLLVEKCRFGAIVHRDDGVLMGIGFRKIWPMDPGLPPS